MTNKFKIPSNMKASNKQMFQKGLSDFIEYYSELNEWPVIETLLMMQTLSKAVDVQWEENELMKIAVKAYKNISEEDLKNDSDPGIKEIVKLAKKVEKIKNKIKTMREEKR